MSKFCVEPKLTPLARALNKALRRNADTVDLIPIKPVERFTPQQAAPYAAALRKALAP